MAEPFIGEIRTVGFSFAPAGWALCNGQLLPIQQNNALFSLLGTFYGGDGITSFALPNLQGRVAIHHGGGGNLSQYSIGQTGGTESETLLVNHLPAHTHPLNANNVPATQSSPSGAAIAQINDGTAKKPGLGLGFAPGTPSSPMATGSVGNTGGGAPINVLQPYLVLNFIIALQGIYPAQS